MGWLGISTVLAALTYLNAAEAGIPCHLGPGGLLLVGAMTRRRGVLVLGHSPARQTANPKASSAGTPIQGRGFAIMGIYIVMIGVGAFLEKPALKGLAATQLNALMGIALAVGGHGCR